MCVKGLHVRACVKIYMRVFWVDFARKSAILHAIYVRVSAAMPVACTVWWTSRPAWVYMHENKASEASKVLFCLPILSIELINMISLELLCA